MILFAALFAAAPAFAEDSLADSEDEFGFLLEGDANAAAREANQITDEAFDPYAIDDDEFGDFQLATEPAGEATVAPRRAATATAAPPPAAVQVGLPYAVEGRSPLTSNYPAEVVHVDRDSVVVELPVLVGRTPDDFHGNYWLVGEVYVGGAKVGETRQLVTQNSLALSGPTVAFLKVQAPVSAAKGEVEVRVSRSNANGDLEPLFESKASYTL